MRNKSYDITNLDRSSSDIIDLVYHAERSQLLVPPRLQDSTLYVSEVPNEHGHVGIFSSGSTSIAKCIWNTIDHLKLNAKYSAEAFEVSPKDRVLIIASPWHVAGLTWGFMAKIIGADYRFIQPVKGEYNKWLQAIDDFDPHYLITVPAVLRALYDEQWKVDNIIFGGSSIKNIEYDLLAPHCDMIYQGYGQTEAGGLISAYKRKSTVIPFETENQCFGTPIYGVQIECEGSFEEPDSIRIKSDTAVESGFYDTRDIGYISDKGNLYLVGRKDEIIRSKSRFV